MVTEGSATAGWLTVDGARIEVLSWGDPGLPGLLLTHGYAANAHWWSTIAPKLAKHRRVVAFSSSGMGQSDWRPSYTLQGYAREIREVARQAGLFDGPVAPVIAAHSFGGCGAVLAVTAERSAWGGLILIDSRVDDSFTFLVQRKTPKPVRLFADKADIVARFRLIPAQDCRDVEMFAVAADHSVRYLDRGMEGQGWCWATDPALFVSFEGQRLLPLLPRISCPLAFLAGANSYLVRDGHLREIERHLPTGTPVQLIADAGHHVLLDQPEAVAGFLLSTLSNWEASGRATDLGIGRDQPLID